MTVRFLKDYEAHKAGEVADVMFITGKALVAKGVAEPFVPAPAIPAQAEPAAAPAPPSNAGSSPAPEPRQQRRDKRKPAAAGDGPVA